MPSAAEIPALLSSFGVTAAAPHRREDATVWDLELDGNVRRGLRVTLIHDARPGGALMVWAHLAPPLGDGLRAAYRRLLQLNDRFPFAKFAIAEDGRPTLSVELRASDATPEQVRDALARVLLIADALVRETAEWIWIGGKVPPDPGGERRNRPLLAGAGDLAERLEG
jgi:hypothetical protein